MDGWLKASGLDKRFVDFTIFMCVAVWPWLLLTTYGLAGVAWPFVLVCQATALPFAVAGWSAGFRLAKHQGWRRRSQAMAAGWMALLWAEVGMAVVLWPWFGAAAGIAGVWALPMLAVQVTGGVLWFYGDETWPVETRRGVSGQPKGIDG